MSNKSLRFKLQIACDNAAFEDDRATELARILRDLASRLERGEKLEGPGCIVRDINGNFVGTATIARVRTL